MLEAAHVAGGANVNRSVVSMVVAAAVEKLGDRKLQVNMAYRVVYFVYQVLVLSPADNGRITARSVCKETRLSLAKDLIYKPAFTVPAVSYLCLSGNYLYTADISF